MIYRMIKQYSKFSSLIVWNLDRKSNNLNFWCFTPLSAIFQLYQWRPVLVVEEARVPGENHRTWASNW